MKPVGIFPGAQAPLVFPDTTERCQALLTRLEALPALPTGSPGYRVALRAGWVSSLRDELERGDPELERVEQGLAELEEKVRAWSAVSGVVMGNYYQKRVGTYAVARGRRE